MKVHKRASDGCSRRKMHSPGRPPVWQRENQCRFWQAIARERSSEEAAIDAGVSAPAGVRWFRKGGGMPPTHLAPTVKPVGARYLTFEEREDIAIAFAKGAGVRAIARNLGRSASTISRELRRLGNTSTSHGPLHLFAKTAESQDTGIAQLLSVQALNGGKVDASRPPS